MVISEDMALGLRPGAAADEAYAFAERLQREGQYAGAAARFRALGGYRDSAARATACQERWRVLEYERAERLMREEVYYEAEKIFWSLGDYRDSAERVGQAHDALIGKHDRDLKALRLQQKRKAAKKRREKTVPLLIAALLVCAWFGATRFALPEARYRRALALRAAGDCEGAKRILSSVGDYRDAEALLAGDGDMRFVGYVGETVRLGTYPQTRGGTDDTPIDWQVLACDGEKALLISRRALEALPFNAVEAEATWETCTLREWLNDSFLERAFTPAQRAAILLTDVDNSRRQGFEDYATDGGRDTRDRIFLLSYREAWTYFDSDSARMCDPTEYAIDRGAFTGNSYKTEGRTVGWWWLRSPGPGPMYTANVRLQGSRSYSSSVNGLHGTVRPALWIDLTSGIFDMNADQA